MRVPGQAGGVVTRAWLEPSSQAGVKRVEMARGRAGYGFTLVGQRPCLLSCIVRGSPAEVIGLRPGDRVLNVNGADVSEATHEAVVKLIGSSTGNLRLVVDCSTTFGREENCGIGGNGGIVENGMNGSGGWPPPPAPLLADSCSSDEELMVVQGCGSGVSSNSDDWRGLRSKLNNANDISKVPNHHPHHGPRRLFNSNNNAATASAAATAIAKQEPKNNLSKERPVSEPDLGAYFARWGLVKSNPDLLSDYETSKLTSSDNSNYVKLEASRESVFATSIQSLDNLSLDSNTLNVAMVVGYINSSQLDLVTSTMKAGVVDEDEERLRCVHRCVTRLSVEQSTHSVVMMHVLCDCVQLCDDTGRALVSYPADRLVLSAVCPEDPRFFGLVTLDNVDGMGSQTFCHVFFVDPELYRHEAHDSIRAHFGFQCTADADMDTDSAVGCLEFPQSPAAVLQFVSVLYRDMGDLVERLRARAEREVADNDDVESRTISTRHSGSGDSGIGNASPEETSRRGHHNQQHHSSNHNNKVLSATWSRSMGHIPEHDPEQHVWTDLRPLAPRHVLSQDHHLHLPLPHHHPQHQPNYHQQQPLQQPPQQQQQQQQDHRSAFTGRVRRCLLAEPLPGSSPSTPSSSISEIGVRVLPVINDKTFLRPPPPPYAHVKSISSNSVDGMGFGTPVARGNRRKSQRWPSVAIRTRWQRSRHHDDDGGDSSSIGSGGGGRPPLAKSRTLPTGMNQVLVNTYVEPALCPEGMPPPRTVSLYNEPVKKLFGWNQQNGHREKEEKEKSSRFWGISRARCSMRRPSAHPKRLSLARSLDDLESAAASDSELRCAELQACGSESSLNSNGSLPGPQSHRRLSERRVASWAVSFERLLQDPVGVRYFSEFLKKEFSEENLLFWQACEFFSQVPENDKKQLSQKAQEIYNSFLSSQASTPVNIDSQAQLADNVLNAPQPDMFKEPQLQIFNLMKFDSYARFLKSTLYQECMLAEVEGRPLPDPYQVPCSPAPSKHSSDRSALHTPKKDKKSNRSHTDLRDDTAEKKRANFFSWTSRNRSFGKGPKKRDLGEFSYGNGRRESQGSLSSSTSQEMPSSSPGGKSECEFRNSVAVWDRNDRSGDRSGGSGGERDRERWPRQCSVSLPDGSCCALQLQPGVPVRQLLLELCQRHQLNLAAVDLFLIGGEKPLVLDQDSVTLCSRDLRLEKRTLFRLDLLPINRSVGLKAKPTKPVSEVLRPVVAKYGLRLPDLVARVSGESEILDLGVPISNLDGLRVVLEKADPSGKDKPPKTPKGHAPPLANRSMSTPGDDRSSGKRNEEKNNNRDPFTPDAGRRKPKKSQIEEAEEFFELLSKAQSSRAEDQRGLLRKEDLVLPDFLRLDPSSSSPCATSSTPTCSSSHKPPHSNGLNTSAPQRLHQHQRSQTIEHTGTHGDGGEPFRAPLSPILAGGHRGSSSSSGGGGGGQGHRALEEMEGGGDLTLVAEGDITSPNSTLLPPPSSSSALHTPIGGCNASTPAQDRSLPAADYTPPTPCLLQQQQTPGGSSSGDVVGQASGISPHA
ncbi:regulator of G-protein signaling 12 [Engraulis encrasicolus]|uniref:regulator of G-protein signaling 12 n=1 Tax=Engraulis encrasicolus TaxID=184585 RepID=UPI002FD56B4D